MYEILDGKKTSAAVKEDVKTQVEKLGKIGITCSLAVIIVGDNPASKIYVNNKKKACEFCGIRSLEYALPEDTSENELLSLIEKLNLDKSVNGILCQLPLPKHINAEKVIDKISEFKDVDAFHPVNVGKMLIGNYDFAPCTPSGIIELLKRGNVDICGKNVVVVGRSNIVGKPMAALLLHNDATVTVCHSKTVGLKDICRNADIIVMSVGKPKFLTADMVKDGAVIVDVGMDRDENGKLCGDVDFDNVAPLCSAITPVPGGVGPMTIAMLMRNTLMAAIRQNGITEDK